jgi:hypothetical protein
MPPERALGEAVAPRLKFADLHLLGVSGATWDGSRGHLRFVSPHVPPWGRVSSEQFDARPVPYQSNDQITKQVRFLTMTGTGDQVDVDDTVVFYQR